ERLFEPLWLDEENPAPTEYKKILRLTNIESKDFDLHDLLETLRPICFFTEGKENLFRDRDTLVKELRRAVPTLDEYYTTQEKQDDHRDLASSVKVVL
ncbi:MAG TPA: polysaccharide biosynthesis protein, partial [Treponema sp.]|nr:polysaccharide biosynthesis protein [Treponema sp.]